MNSKDTRGFKQEVWRGFDGRPVYEWNSQFSDYRVQPSGKGYTVIGRADDVGTVCLLYFDTFVIFFCNFFIVSLQIKMT